MVCAMAADSSAMVANASAASADVAKLVAEPDGNAGQRQRIGGGARNGQLCSCGNRRSSSSCEVLNKPDPYLLLACSRHVLTVQRD